MPRTKAARPPQGLSRLFYRLPIAVYRVGLGRLLGPRLLLLEHTGRKSGLTRRAVLEVLRRDEPTDTVFLSSGFGDRSDWYRNLLATPCARIEHAGRSRDIVARVVSPEESEREVFEYARRYPRSLRSVARLVGWEIDGTDDDLRAFARELRIVALEPASGARRTA